MQQYLAASLTKFIHSVFIWYCISAVFSCFGAYADNMASTESLGRGYATYNQELLANSAIKSLQVKTSSPQGDLNFEVVESKKEAAADFGMDGSTEVPVKSVHLKPALKFLKNHRADDHTLSFIYRLKHTFKFSAFPKDEQVFKLSEESQAQAEEDPKGFAAAYGNAFITGIEAGAAIYFMVKIHFENAGAKTNFSDKFEASQRDIGAVKSAMKATLSEMSDNGRITVEVKQFGGDPVKLMTFLADKYDLDDKSDAGKQSEGGLVQTWSLKEEFSGESLLERVTEYAATLSTQIDPDNPKTLFPFGTPELMSYKSMGLNLPSEDSEVMEEETIAARETIKLKYIEQQAMGDKYEIPFYTQAHLQRQLSSSADKSLTALREYYDRLTSFFEDNDKLRGCYSTGREDASCSEAVEILKAMEPADYRGLLKKIEHLNFTVNIDDINVLLPVGFRNKNDIQRFARSDANSKHIHNRTTAEIQIVTQDKKDTTMYELASSTQIVKYRWSGGNGTKEWKTATATDARQYQVPNGGSVSFGRFFALPHVAGSVYLHVPFGSAFAGKMKNKVTGEVMKRTAGMKPSGTGLSVNIGDIIKVGPWGSKKKKEYIVTDTNDDEGQKDKRDKLPLGGIIKVSGSLRSPGYHLERHDSASN